MNPMTYIEIRPVIPRLIVIKPIQNVFRQSFAVQCAMFAKGKYVRLSREIGPSLVEASARFTEPQAPGISLEHLQAPTQCRGQAQGPVVVKPALIEIASGHARRDAKQSFRLFRGSQQLRRTLIGKSVHADAAVGLR